VSIGSGTVAPGESITVPLTAQIASGVTLGTIGVVVHFDPATLSVAGCTPAETCNTNLGGQVIFSGAYGTGLTGTVSLAQLSFTALGPAGTSSSLMLTLKEFVDLLAMPLPVTTQDGLITVRLSTPSPTPTLTPTIASCTGDCNAGSENADGKVTVDEIITMVNIALELREVSACENGDADGSGTIEIPEIIAAVNNALNGCTARNTPP